MTELEKQMDSLHDVLTRANEPQDFAPKRNDGGGGSILPPPNTRRFTLEEADRAVNGSRDTTHGQPEDNFARIARRWRAHFANKGIILDITSVDVAILLIDLKLARLVNTPSHQDSWTDVAGYAACGAECATKDKPNI